MQPSTRTGPGTPVPLPPPPLVGRAAELAAVADLRRRGAGGILWTGGPGLGKSHLLDHTAHDLATHGVTVVRLAGGRGPGRVAELPTPSGTAPVAYLVDDVDALPARGRSALLARLSAVPRTVVLATAAAPVDPVPPGVRVHALAPLRPADAAELLAVRLAEPVAPHVAATLAGALAGVPGALLDTAPMLTREQLRGLSLLPDPLPVGRTTRRACAPVVRSLDERGVRTLLLVALASTGRYDVLAEAARTDLACLAAEGLAPYVRLADGRVDLVDGRLRSLVHEESGPVERCGAHSRLAAACAAAGLTVETAWHRVRARHHGAAVGAPVVEPLLRAARARLAQGDAVGAQRLAQDVLGCVSGARRRAALDVAVRAAVTAGHLLDARWLVAQALDLAGVEGAVPARPMPDAGRPAPWTEGLTAREVQVAHAVAQGETNRLVARRLGVSERTVEVHLTRIFRKLGLASRTELALRVATDAAAHGAGVGAVTTVDRAAPATVDLVRPVVG